MNTRNIKRTAASPASPEFLHCSITTLSSKMVLSPPPQHITTANLKKFNRVTPSDQGRIKKIQKMNIHWFVQDGDVPSVPFMYPLQSTSIVISELSPSNIASNIERCLKRLSITVNFDNNKAIANAQTSNQLKFNIRLFTKSTSHEISSTIVEINRMSSPQFGFHKIICAIFKSARGAFNDIEERAITASQTTSKRRKVCIDMTKRSSDEDDELVSDAIKCIGKLLTKDRYDANHLGMENLVYLTKSEDAETGVAFKMAKSVLFKENYCLEGLQQKVYNMIVMGKTNTGNEEVYGDQFLKSYNLKMRTAALNVLLNSLETMSFNSTNISLDTVCKDMWLGDEMIDVLMNDLKNVSLVSHGAHVAHVSLRCLHLLTMNSQKFRSKIQRQLDIVEDAVKKTQNFGEQSHDLLARESESFLSRLNCTYA